MAVKTITIDLDAYELLARRKRAGQSFSQVIKQHFRSRGTAAEFRTLLKGARLSDETLDSVESQIEKRRKSPARPVRL